MKLRHSIIPLSLISGLLLSCDNPADETTDAKVGDAQTKELEAGPEGSVKYVFTDASSIKFIGSKVNGSTQEGTFTKVTGHFTIKDGKPVGNDHKVEIDMDAITTGDDKLTGHLKNEDFFDVPNNPTSIFDVTKIEKKSDSEYEVTGNLTMRGKTNSVAFPATVDHTEGVAKITAKFDIKRYQWDINFKGAGENLLNEEVILEFNLEAKAE